MSSKGLTLVLLWSSLSASQEEKKLANFVAFLFRNVFFMRFFQFYLELWYICWVRSMCSTVVHTSERMRICRIFVSSCQCITPSIRNVPVVPVVYICSISSTSCNCSTTIVLVYSSSNTAIMKKLWMSHCTFYIHNQYIWWLDISEIMGYELI